MLSCNINLKIIAFLSAFLNKNAKTLTLALLQKELISRKITSNEDLKELFDKVFLTPKLEIAVFINLFKSRNEIKTSSDFISKLKLDDSSEENKPSEDDSSNEMQILELLQIYNKTEYDREVDDIYKHVRQVNSLRIKDFNSDLVQAVIIRTKGNGQRSFVETARDLQLSIINYKTKLFNNIVNFLKGLPEYKNIFTNEKNKMYSSEYILNEEYYLQVMNAMYDYLSKHDVSDELSKSYLQNTDKTILEVVKSYLNLKYFDEILSQQKVLKVRKELKGFNVGLRTKSSSDDIIKYTVNLDNDGAVKDWSKGEVRDGIKEASGLSKQILENTPVINRRTGDKTGKNLSATKVIQSWNRLIHFIVLNKYNDDTYSNIVDNIYNFTDSPLQSIMNILSDLFLNKEGSLNPKSEKIEKIISGTSGKGYLHDAIHNYYDFTEFDANVLYTFFVNFLRPNKDSFFKIENDQIESGRMSLTNLLFSEIMPGLLLRINPNLYLETYYNFEKGTYLTRNKPLYDNNKDVLNYKKDMNSNFATMSNTINAHFIQTYGTESDGDYKKLLISTNSITVKIGNKVYEINLSGPVMNTTAQVKTTILEGKTNITNNFTEYFSRFTPEKINQLNRYFLTGNYDDESTKFVGDFLKFIEDCLNINLTDERGLNILSTMLLLENRSHPEVMRVLLGAAARVAFAHSLKNQYIHDNTDKPLSEWLPNSTTPFRGYTDFRKILTRVRNQETFDVVGNIPWMDWWFEAASSYSGANLKSVLKNFENNSIPNTRPSSVGGQFRTHLANLSTGAASKLLFSSRTASGIISCFSAGSDLQSEYGIKKSYERLNVSELIYNSFVNNFLNTLIGSNSIGTQMTVYSDKITILQALIDIGKLFGQDAIKLQDLSNNDIEKLYLKTVGNYFLTQVKEVKTDLIKILNADVNSTLQDLNTLLLSLTLNDLIALRRKYNSEHPEDKVNIANELHYKENKDGSLGINPQLLYYENLFSNLSLLKERFRKEKLEFIQGLYEYNFKLSLKGVLINFLQDSKTKELLKQWTGLEKNEFIEQWVHNGKMVLAKNANGEVITKKEDVTGNCVINPLLEKYFYYDNLISGNLKYSFVGAETSHTIKAKINILKALEETGLFNDLQISSLSADIFSLYNGLNSVEYTDVQKQAIKKIFNNINYSMIASAENTSYKRNIIIPATFDARDTKSLRGSTSKVKVAILGEQVAPVYTVNGDRQKIDADDGGGTVMSFEVIQMNGSLLDKAVSYDVVKSIGYNYDLRTGCMSELKFAAHTISNAKMRLAINGMNDGSTRISLHSLFKKLSNITWSPELQNIDITNSKLHANRTEINFTSDITSGTGFFNNSLYYEELGTIYQIRELLKINNIYYTIERTPEGKDIYVAQLFNEKDEPIKVRQQEGLSNEDFFTQVEALGMQSINSLYKLWEAMGGMDTGHYEEDEFVHDESSHYAVVNFMNNVTIKRPNAGILKVLNNYYQPLKDTYIHYAVPPSTMKTGQFNVNSVDSWYNDEVPEYMEFSSETFGPQQDPDHTADESEMSEFTLVIASLDSGGKTHWIAKTVFSDLGRLAENILSEDFKALEDYIQACTSPDVSDVEKAAIKSKLYEIIGEEFIRNGSTRQESLGASIINRVRNEFNISKNHSQDLHKLPFSDPNIYSLVIGSYITRINKAIKRKHPGSGDVIMPSYNACCIWELNGIPYTFEDLYREASKITKLVRGTNLSILDYKRQVVKEFLDSEQKKVLPLSEDLFEPTDIVNVYDVKGNLIKVLDLDDIDTYYAFVDSDYEKLGLDSSQMYVYKTNVTRNRNLRPQRTIFTYTSSDGATRKSNLFNLRSVWEKFHGMTPTISTDEELEKLKNGEEVEVRYKGEFIKVRANLGSIETFEAEVILSNNYKTRLGQGHRTLNDILVNGIKVAPYKALDYENTDLIFVNNTGNHTLISLSPIAESSRTKLNEWKHFETFLDKHGNLHITTKIKNNLVEIGRGVLKEGYELNDEGKFTDEKGGILEDLSKYIEKLGKVYEKNIFLNRYNLVVYGKDTVNNYNLYSIDFKKIADVFEIQRDKTKSFSEEGYLKYITENILVNLYEGNGHLQINDKIKGVIKEGKEDVKAKIELISKMLDSMTYSNRISEQEKTFIEQTKDCLRFYNPKKGMKNSETKNKLGKIYRPYQILLESDLKRRREKKLAQFEMSRYVTAARIPAQSLQSYMKMKAVAYIDSRSNLAMVSRWQTFLQGSDYDIDKAYIMGFSFDDNGNFLKWSPLFRDEALQESCLLPTPNGKQIQVVSTKEEGIDLSQEFKILVEHYYIEDPKKIKRSSRISVKLLALIISKIDLYPDKEVPIYIGDETMVKYATGIINDINAHENYKIPERLIEEIYKNSVSAKIQAIVSDISNLPLAYSYITMRDLSNISSETPEGRSSGNMTGMNPLTKFVMQYLNMVGKEVIGIAAVGEKVFMGLSYYYNEMVRNISDLEHTINFLTFYQQFNRIQGRYNSLLEGSKKFYGVITPVIKTCLSDVNLYKIANAELVKERLYQVNRIREELLADGKDEAYIKMVLGHNSNKYRKVDLIISQLLSAATDNAKELILKKINSDANMAGIYIHLLMLGFNINDIVAFMTSPAVETLVKRTNTNMFYKYNNSFIARKDMTFKIDEALGKLNANLYFVADEYGELRKILKTWAREHSAYAYSLVSDEPLSKRVGKNIENNKKLKTNDYSQAAILSIVIDPDLLSDFSSKVNNADYIEEVELLATQIRDAVKTIQANTGLDFDEALRYYIDDIKEFKKIHDISQETTALGTTLMGLNKGLSTDLKDLNSRVNRINKFVKKQMLKYGTLNKVDTSKEDWYTDERVVEFIENVLEAKPFLRQEGETIDLYAANIINTLKDTIDAGINRFSFLDYLMDLNEYRKKTAEFYNLIKDQWNIFDIIEKSPQYKAALNTFKLGLLVPIATITKNKILSVIQDEIRNSSERVTYLSPTLEKQLQAYADTLLISKWLESPIGDSRITFPVKKGMTVFTDSMQSKISEIDYDSEIISTALKATFKKWIEDDLIPELITTGSYTYNGNTVTIGKNNKLLKLLIKTIDSNSPIYKVNMKLNEIDTSLDSSKQFQEVLNAVLELKSQKIGNYTIADYLMLYSIGTSLNRYGNDRLTGIFRELVKYDLNSLMSKFLDYEGNIDSTLNAISPSQLREFLRDFGFTVRDALMAIAPYYNPNLIADLGKYVRDSKSMKYKKHTGDGRYEDIDLFESYGLNEEESNKAMYNLSTYGMLYLPSKDSNANYYSQFMSDDIDDVKDALIRAIKSKYLLLRKKC